MDPVCHDTARDMSQPDLPGVAKARDHLTYLLTTNSGLLDAIFDAEQALDRAWGIQDSPRQYDHTEEIDGILAKCWAMLYVAPNDYLAPAVRILINLIHSVNHYSYSPTAPWFKDMMDEYNEMKVFLGIKPEERFTPNGPAPKWPPFPPPTIGTPGGPLDYSDPRR